MVTKSNKFYQSRFYKFRDFYKYSSSMNKTPFLSSLFIIGYFWQILKCCYRKIIRKIEVFAVNGNCRKMVDFPNYFQVKNLTLSWRRLFLQNVLAIHSFNSRFIWPVFHNVVSKQKNFHSQKESFLHSWKRQNYRSHSLAQISFGSKGIDSKGIWKKWRFVPYFNIFRIQRI